MEWFRNCENSGRGVLQNSGKCRVLHWKFERGCCETSRTNRPTFGQQTEVMSRKLHKFLTCVRKNIEAFYGYRQGCWLLLVGKVLRTLTEKIGMARLMSSQCLVMLEDVQVVRTICTLEKELRHLGWKCDTVGNEGMMTWIYLMVASRELING